MKKFKIGCSPITSTIYAGFVSDKTKMWIGTKHDVTDSALGAVAENLLQTDQSMYFDYKGKKYVLKVEEVK